MIVKNITGYTRTPFYTPPYPSKPSVRLAGTICIKTEVLLNTGNNTQRSDTSLRTANTY